MFEGFCRKRISTRETVINLRQGGDGPAILFLHGYPQTHVMWHKVAPLLAEGYTVVCPDLRGYGDSGAPASDDTHLAYSKRSMAQDQVEVMQALGFEKFAVIGHDRGARVAHRMSLDHPEKVTKLTLLDIVPTRTVFASIDREVASDHYHWFFLIQPGDLPERLIGSAPDFYLEWIFSRWCNTPGSLTHKACDEYRRCFDAATIHATCEDYRAGATIDLIHDEVDRVRQVTCPLLLLWSETGTGATYDMLSVWKTYATNVRGRALDCGHFLAEERPAEVVAEIQYFLGEAE